MSRSCVRFPLRPRPWPWGPSWARVGAVLGLLGLGGGCGPLLADELPTATSAGGADSPEGSTTSSESDPGTSAGDDDTTAPAADSAADDDTAADDGEYTCGCEARFPVTLGEVIDDGFSAADILEQVRQREIPFEWVGLHAPSGDTVLRLTLVYEGGEILHGPDGNDGCGFFSAPCDNTLVIPVAATVTTDDGIFEATIPSKVEVDLDRYVLALLLDGTVPLDQTRGTLAEHVEQEVEEIRLSLMWHLDGSWDEAYLQSVVEWDYELLGRGLE
ncbi:MAG: hypothetical protein KDK70_26335 [Myxococcales bacterium]|nr:hypothetical protein [Myxococcales bacterium]